MQELAAAVDDALDVDDEEKADALQEEGEAVGEQLQALEDGLQDYSPTVKAAAGAIVTIDRNGQAVIHCGCCASRGQGAAHAGTPAPRFQRRCRERRRRRRRRQRRAAKTAAMSDRLAQRLSAHRTAALQIEVARHPQVALAALVHGMVQTVLQESHYGHDLPLGVSLKVQDRLEGMAPTGRNRPPPWRCANCNRWRAKPCPDSAELFAALLAKSQDELVRLLAVCVAVTVDVVTPRTTRQQPGEELAQAVGLDMAAWWKPSMKVISGMCRRPRFWKPLSSSHRRTSPGWRS